MDNIEKALERIALALERIACAMEQKPLTCNPQICQLTSSGATVPQSSSAEATPATIEYTRPPSELSSESSSGTTNPTSALLALKAANPQSQETSSVPEATASTAQERADISQLESEPKEGDDLSSGENQEDYGVFFLQLPSPEQKEDFAKRFPQLNSYLSARDIEICEVFTPQVPLELDERLDEISLFMGRHYPDIASLLTSIKSNLRTGFNLSVDLAPYSSASAKIIDKLCRALYETAFLDEYRYLGYPDFKLQVRASTIGIVHNFFSGFWFERYIAQEIESTVKQVAQEIKEDAGPDSPAFELIRNAKLLCHNVPRERDVLLYCGQDCYWFECKSGDNFIDSITAYERFAASFDFKADNCFLVFLSDEPLFHRTAGTGLQICSSSEFPQRLKDRLLANLTATAS
ncbi:MAG: hypothetical protein K6A35_02150 [bacterium]|nr:hypothetical protein [bacterium]